jgi:hypothetical protein
MRRNFFITGVICIGIGLLSTVAHAEITTPLSEQKQQTIASNCQSAQVALQQIEYNDAATRVNRGQGYEQLLNTYMIPMNIRVTSSTDHALMLATLTNITARYQQSLKNFKKHYEEYDDMISKLIQQKSCANDPESFYNLLNEIRKKRTLLIEDITGLDQIASEYRSNILKLKEAL